MKKIMVLNEHHGELYFDVSTEEQHKKVALSIVRGRFGTDNPYYPLEELIEPTKPDADDTAKPTGLWSTATELSKIYEDDLATYNKELKFRKLLKKCLDENDGALAIKILVMRASCEDDSFDIVNVEDEYPAS